MNNKQTASHINSKNEKLKYLNHKYKNDKYWQKNTAMHNHSELIYDWDQQEKLLNSKYRNYLNNALGIASSAIFVSSGIVCTEITNNNRARLGLAIMNIWGMAYFHYKIQKIEFYRPNFQELIKKYDRNEVMRIVGDRSSSNER